MSIINKKIENIILSDLDGTIVPKTTKIISKQTRYLIRKLKKENIIDTFIIATGRNIDSFKEAIQKYNIDFFDYAICSNGSYSFPFAPTEVRSKAKIIVNNFESGLENIIKVYYIYPLEMS